MKMNKMIMVGMLSVSLIAGGVIGASAIQSNYTASANSAPAAKAGATLTKEQASDIAKNQVGGKVKEVERDNDDGRMIYEVEVQTSQGKDEVDLDIDANTGEVLKVEYDDDNRSTKQVTNKISGTQQSTQSATTSADKASQAMLTKAQASEIAIKHVGGKVDEIERDKDNGRMIYEVELLTTKGEVDIYIDAYTGEILSVDYDDDNDDYDDDDNNDDDDDDNNDDN